VLDEARVAEVLRTVQPDLLVHAQAMSDVDRCELEPDLAQEQNVRATAHIVEALRGTRALLIYISTDYVFDGTKGAPYDETDEPRPISVYGATKLEGERVALGYPRAVVVRPSTLFGPGRMNFCDHIVLRLNAGQTVEAFQDQVTSPTYTEDVAVGIGELGAVLGRSQRLREPRIYHLVNEGRCGRVEFAGRIAALLGHSRDRIRPIPVSAQRRPARRPAYSALATTQLLHTIGRRLRPWEEALHAYLCQRHWLN
jgi:dTDP-4-dehydrorhamnose reductase